MESMMEAMMKLFSVVLLMKLEVTKQAMKKLMVMKQEMKKVVGDACGDEARDGEVGGRCLR